MSGRRASPRHPAARARGHDLASSARSLLGARFDTVVLLGVDGPERAVALAALAVRGRQHRTIEEFAVAYGLGEDLVAGIEAGRVPLDDLPAVLRVLTPVESVALGLGLGPPVVGLSGRGAHE